MSVRLSLECGQLCITTYNDFMSPKYDYDYDLVDARKVLVRWTTIRRVRSVTAGMLKCHANIEVYIQIDARRTCAAYEPHIHSCARASMYGHATHSKFQVPQSDLKYMRMSGRLLYVRVPQNLLDFDGVWSSNVNAEKRSLPLTLRVVLSMN